MEVEFKKIKMLAGGDKGLTATYLEKRFNDGVVSTMEFTIKSDSPVHPDMKEAMSGLRENVQAVFGFKDIEKIIVTGFSVSGQDENEAVVITSMINTGTNPVGLATPRIFIEDDVFGNTEGLLESIEVIKQEANAYIFKGKSSQLNLDFDSKEEEGYVEDNVKQLIAK